MAKAVVSPKKKKKTSLTSGVVHIQSTFNNTIISITDASGNVVDWNSSGSSGFKGSRKSTPYAAQVAAEKVITKAKDLGVVEVEVVVKGIGSGRESAIRSIQASGVKISSIKDVTGIPHNGCRPRKPRRV
ncbi:MAG: 30S ribosomal protein S11 [bacterium]|nr:30S ribosomal protein S11 [bacterium]